MQRKEIEEALKNAKSLQVVVSVTQHITVEVPSRTIKNLACEDFLQEVAALAVDGGADLAVDDVSADVYADGCRITTVKGGRGMRLVTEGLPHLPKVHMTVDCSPEDLERMDRFFQSRGQ